MSALVYVACPLVHVERARRVAAAVVAAGFAVVSRWHVGHGAIVEPRGDARFREELEARADMNHADLEAADVVVALTVEDAGRETYVELGVACAMGLPIVWSVEHGGTCLSWARRNVESVKRDEHLVAVLAGVVRHGGPVSRARMRQVGMFEGAGGTP